MKISTCMMNTQIRINSKGILCTNALAYFPSTQKSKKQALSALLVLLYIL